MTRFDRAIKHVLEHEGYYSNHVADTGGETWRGISRRHWSNWSGWKIIDIVKHEIGFPECGVPALNKALMANDELDRLTKQLYRLSFWHPMYDKLEHEGVAIKLLDMAVNMGATQAHKILQRAIGVSDDGIFGPQTLRTANATLHLVELLCQQQAAFYTSLVAMKPTQRVFLNGWLNRAAWYPTFEGDYV